MPRGWGISGQLPALLPLAAVLAVTLLVYFPVTRVYFHDDDFTHFFVMSNRGPWYFLLESTGAHMYLARNAALLFMRAVFGFRPEPYMWLSLLTHLVVTGLVFRAAMGLTRNPAAAAFGSAMWATSPLESGVEAWHAAYGQQLSALAMVWVVGSAVREGADGPVSARRAVGWAALVGVGAACFGTGLAFALVSPLVLLLLMEHPRRERPVLYAFASLPVVVGATYWLYASTANTPVIPAWLPAEARAYVDQPHGTLRPMFAGVLSVGFRAAMPVAQMLLHLTSFSINGLLRSFSFFPDAPYPSRWASVVAVSYATVVLARGFLGDPLSRRRMLALLILALAMYGMIALGRANLYLILGTAPAESARELRYHYAGAIPVALLISLAVSGIARALRMERSLPAIALAGWTALAATSWSTTRWSIDEKRPIRDQAVATKRAIDAAIDGSPAGSTVRIRNQPWLGADDSELPGWAAFFTMAYQADEVRGRRVTFVDTPELCRAFAGPENHRMSRLLECP